MLKTLLFAKEKGFNFGEVFICEFQGYVTLFDEAVQKKIANLENLGFHGFSTTICQG